MYTEDLTPGCMGEAAYLMSLEDKNSEDADWIPNQRFGRTSLITHV